MSDFPNEIGAGDALAIYDLPDTTQEAFAAGYNQALAEVKAQFERKMQDAQSWQDLKEMHGSWRDGSDATVKIHTDDATQTTFIEVSGKRYYQEGQGLDSAISEYRRQTLEAEKQPIPIEVIKYTSTFDEGPVDVYLFYPEGYWDNRKLTLEEAEERYPSSEYAWNFVSDDDDDDDDLHSPS